MEDGLKQSLVVRWVVVCLRVCVKYLKKSSAGVLDHAGILMESWRLRLQRLESAQKWCKTLMYIMHILFYSLPDVCWMNHFWGQVRPRRILRTLYPTATSFSCRNTTKTNFLLLPLKISPTFSLFLVPRFSTSRKLHVYWLGTIASNSNTSFESIEQNLKNSNQNLYAAAVWGMSVGNIYYEVCGFSVFPTIQEITLPVEKIEGYSIAMITAPAPEPHMWASPDPGPDSKCFKTVEFGCVFRQRNFDRHVLSHGT